MWKDWHNVVQIVKTLLVDKNENAPAVFTICIKHQSKAKNRDLGFTSAG